jgi:hypothetical protein
MAYDLLLISRDGRLSLQESVEVYPWFKIPVYHPLPYGAPSPTLDDVQVAAWRMFQLASPIGIGIPIYEEVA